MTSPLRVVLDTNLVLSALVFPAGRVASLRELWQQQQFLPLVSQPTLAELIRALGYPKFRLTLAEQEELLADYLPFLRRSPFPILRLRSRCVGILRMCPFSSWLWPDKPMRWSPEIRTSWLWERSVTFRS